MMNVKGCLFLGAIGFLVTGAYDLFIEAGVSRDPRRIEIAKLALNPPWNRHLTITDSELLVSEAVKYWKSRHGVTLSEDYYIPLREKSFVGIGSLSPKVLIKVSKSRMDQIRQGKGISAEAIRGIRMTKWDIAGKVKELLQQTYGERAAQKMMVIDLERTPVGLVEPLGKLAAGIALALLTIIPWAKSR